MIRHATIDDTPKLLPLLSELGYPATLEDLNRRFLKFSSNSGFGVAVCEMNEEITGLYMKSELRPIELAIVVQSEVNPWRYPPTFDFQYGEWLRGDFERGTIEPWPSKEMADLAVLITQLLLASKTLFGQEPSQLLPTVPYSDFMKALVHAIPELMPDIENDTRNVLLTLARIWSTVKTDTIYSKPAAAEWAIDNLPEKYRPVMERAKNICKGQVPEHWEDVAELIKPCGDYIVKVIDTEIMLSDNSDRSVKIA